MVYNHNDRMVYMIISIFAFLSYISGSAPGALHAARLHLGGADGFGAAHGDGGLRCGGAWRCGRRRPGAGSTWVKITSYPLVMSK